MWKNKWILWKVIFCTLFKVWIIEISIQKSIKNAFCKICRNMDFFCCAYYNREKCNGSFIKCWNAVNG